MPVELKPFLPLGLAFAVSLALSLAAGVVARRLGIVSRPRPDRWGRGGVPLLGGVAVAIAFFAAVCVFCEFSAGVAGVFAAAVLMLAVGLFDDVKSLKPFLKVAGSLAAGAVAFFCGVSVDVFYPYASLPLTMLWFAAVVQAVNVLDNMDGLAAGVAVVCGLIMLVDQRAAYADPQVGVLAAAAAGAAGGFLVRNFPPAKIYLGDAGSLFLGAVLAAVSISGTWKDASNVAVTLIVPVFVLAVPLFEVLFVSMTRKKEGRPITRGGTDHVSHRLVRLGLSERSAVLLLYLVCAFLGVVAFYFKHSAGTLAVTFALVLAALAGAGCLLYRGTKGDS